MSNANAVAHHVLAQQAARPRRVDGVLEPLGGQRILAAHVDESLLAPGREGGDRHRLDEAERVAFHDDPILERARLGLVGVADQVVRPHRLVRDGVPLPCRWGTPRRPAPAAWRRSPRESTPSGPSAIACRSASYPPCAR